MLRVLHGGRVQLFLWNQRHEFRVIAGAQETVHLGSVAKAVASITRRPEIERRLGSVRVDGFSNAASHLLLVGGAA